MLTGEAWFTVHLKTASPVGRGLNITRGATFVAIRNGRHDGQSYPIKTDGMMNRFVLLSTKIE